MAHGTELKDEVRQILKGGRWIRDGSVVPLVESVGPGNHGVRINAIVLSSLGMLGNAIVLGNSSTCRMRGRTRADRVMAGVRIPIRTSRSPSRTPGITAMVRHRRGDPRDPTAVGQASAEQVEERMRTKGQTLMTRKVTR